MDLVPVFDLDGTLIDSDAALVDAFVALGVERQAVSFGHVLATECERLGVDMDAYLAAYDEDQAQPFAGTDALIGQLGRWAVCSNKHRRSGQVELARLGWKPDLAMFSETFDGPKRLGPVLDALGLAADQILFVGDTAHDRLCAAEVGAMFALAGWNPRAVPGPDDLVLRQPSEVLGVLDGSVRPTATG
jgi:HAD superfamily hydrolase (TIGR01549 family)